MPLTIGCIPPPSDFEGAMPARYLRHGSQPEEVAAIRDMPQLEPFWAAGFSFSRGHFKLQVPYDGYQPMVFQVGILSGEHGMTGRKQIQF